MSLGSQTIYFQILIIYQEAKMLVYQRFNVLPRSTSDIAVLWETSKLGHSEKQLVLPEKTSARKTNPERWKWFVYYSA